MPFVAITSSFHLIKTANTRQQQQCACRFRNRRRCRARPLNHDVVDAIVSRRRGRTVEDNPEYSVRIVVQPRDRSETEHKWHRAKRGRRCVRRIEIDKGNSVETVLELIAVESGARPLSRKTHDDICKAGSADSQRKISAVIGICGSTL